MNVGYIGLGALGGSLARQLPRDHDLTVWDLNGRAVAALEQAGARGAATAADVGRRCEVVLLCLPRSSDVQAALFGPDGLAAGLSAGTLVIDQTSGVPDETRDMAAELASRGCDMIDAAVSASPEVALRREATLMVGGLDAVVGRALPLLQGIARTVHRCGSRVGDGQAMKMVNNAMNGVNRLGTLEVVAMGRKLGLSLRAMTDALNGGRGANITTERMLPAIAEGRESTNFGLALMLKDVNQAVSLGLKLGRPMPITSTARSLFQIGLNTMGADARLEEVIGLTERLADIRLRDDGEGSQDADPDLLALVDAAVAAIGAAVTQECASVGARYGLSLAAMAAVLNESSGWSRASRQILPDMAAGNRSGAPEGRDVARDLAQAARLAIQCGAPTMILNVVRSALEPIPHEVGAPGVGDGVETARPVSFQER